MNKINKQLLDKLMRREEVEQSIQVLEQDTHIDRDAKFFLGLFRTALKYNNPKLAEDALNEVRKRV